MSIPATLRRRFGLDKNKRVLIYAEKDGLKIRPVKDLFELAGTFKTKKKYSQKKLDKGFAVYMAEQAASGLK